MGSGLVLDRFLIGFSDPKSMPKAIRRKVSDKQKVLEKPITKSMSALLRQRLFRTEIDEKSYVCWDIDFGGVLAGFSDDFGRLKSSIFAVFSIFFRSKLQ